MSQSFQYTLHRSRRRRRSAALMVKSDGEIVVQAPLFMPKFMIDHFVKEKENWINKRKKELEKPIVKLTPKFNSIEELQSFIEKTLHHYEDKMDLTAKQVKYRHVKSYWGNCKSDGTITFNLDLIYATQKEIEYVIIHELAHLKYRGHGVRFWDFVNKYCPTTSDSRSALRSLGRNTRNTL